MVTKNVTNLTQSPLGIPRGAVVPPGGTIRVKDWELKEGNAVLKSWIDIGALKVEDAEEREEEDDGRTKLEQAGGGLRPVIDPELAEEANRPRTEEEFQSMTKAQLTSYIEANGGTVASGSVKEDLVAQAFELSQNNG